jgi:hypothetical protein
MAAVLYPNPCPVCACHVPEPFVSRDPYALLACPNCGSHRITEEAVEDLPGVIHDGATRACVAFGVRKLPEGALITSALVESIARTVRLPRAMERIDNLVLYLAENFAPGERTTLDPSTLCARLGTATAAEAQWVIEEALQGGVVKAGHVPPGPAPGGWIAADAVLTIQGWRRHAELMRDGAGSRHAFMAMKFGDAEMNRIYAGPMRSAVAQTDFDLRTVAGDHQTAGSIDNRMRVELRTSRFVVCDLTHGNRGAYWEAGFAEGLGRPVFYTCRRDVLADRMHVDHPHFDTAHQLIVAWDPDDPAPGMQALKNVIRATLPTEARLEDD